MRYRSPLLRSLQHALPDLDAGELRFVLRVAVLQADDTPRAQMRKALGCSELELAAAIKTLGTARDEHVSIVELMEAA